jgi:hypothetical protein
MHIDNRDVQRNTREGPSSIRGLVELGGAVPSLDGACEDADAVHPHILSLLLVANAIACATATRSAPPAGCDSVAVAALIATMKRVLPTFEEAVQHPGNIATAAALCKSTMRVLFRGGDRVPSKAETTSLLTAGCSVLSEEAGGEILALTDKRDTRGLLLLVQDGMPTLPAVSESSAPSTAEAATVGGSRDVAALLSQFQRYAFVCGDAHRSAYQSYGLGDNKPARGTLAGLLLAVFQPRSGSPAAAWVDAEDMPATCKPAGNTVMDRFFMALLKRCQEADVARWNRLFAYGYLFCGAYTSAAKGGGVGALVKLQLGLIGAIAEAHEWSPSAELVKHLPAAMRPLEPLSPSSAAAGTGIAASPAVGDAPLRLKLLQGSTAAALDRSDPDTAPRDLDLPATAVNALFVLNACAAAKTWYTRTQKDVLLLPPTGGRRIGERAGELKCSPQSMVGPCTPVDGTAPIGAQRLLALGRSLQLRPLDKIENPYAPEEALVANKGGDGQRDVTCKRLAQQAGWLFNLADIVPRIAKPATTAPGGARGIARPVRKATSRKTALRRARSARTAVLPAPDASLAAPRATSGATISTPSSASGSPPSSGPGAVKRRRVETAAEPCPATVVCSTARDEPTHAVSAAAAVGPTAVAAAAVAADAVIAEAAAAAASSRSVAMLHWSTAPRALPSLPQALGMQCEAATRQHWSAAEAVLFRCLWREGIDDASVDEDISQDDDCDDDESYGPAMEGITRNAFGAAGCGAKGLPACASGMHSAEFGPAE